MSLENAMNKMGETARDAARILATIPSDRKNGALWAMAEALSNAQMDILKANTKDVEGAKAAGKLESYIDRLSIDEERLNDIAKSLVSMTDIPDPVGSVIKAWDRPNGLHIEQVRVPIGVIGVIYESRPNVTADAAGLCLKSGNAVILRPGSDSLGTAKAIHAALISGLRKSELPEGIINLVPTADRDAVGCMLAGLNGNMDVIVPRGGKSLVARVQDDARVPVFAHLEGICHVYVDGAADLGMARDIVLNAKMRRTGICGAAETLLVDRACVDTHLAPLTQTLLDGGCDVRGDEMTCGVDPRVTLASEDDWRVEYLSNIISVKIIDGIDAAIDHINHYGSHHTDAIVTSDDDAAKKFMSRVDSAIVMHNTSTQFADGGEFGFGAEIGIATGRMHARGPVGAEQLTTMQYRVSGAGQTRD